MVTIAYHVHAAPDEAVTNQVRADQPVASVLAGERHTVGSGWLDGPWDVRVSANPAEPTDPYVWWIAQPSTTGTPTESRLSLSEAPSIETLVEHDRTYVLAKVPRSMAGANLHVNITGFPSTQLLMIDVDPRLDAEFAAYAFSEAVPFTAQIVDASGQTVASWPTT
jgi:hypothetical protein